jgi:hypothetical protein
MTTDLLTRATDVLPVLVDELKSANDAEAVIVERCIRDNGREFEYAYRCDADPAKAKAHAEAVRKRIDYIRSPSVRQVSDCEWSVHYWSAD